MNASGNAMAMGAGAATPRWRGFALAGAVGLAALAAVVATHRPQDPATAARIDGLRVEEARLMALKDGTEAIALPAALADRRGEPTVAAAFGAAQRALATDRARFAAQRDRLAQQIDETRAQRDLFEARNTMLQMRLVQAFTAHEAAQQRHDTAAVTTLNHQIDELKTANAAAEVGAADASRRAIRLAASLSAMTRTTQAAAARRLVTVREQLSNAGA